MFIYSYLLSHFMEILLIVIVLASMMLVRLPSDDAKRKNDKTKIYKLNRLGKLESYSIQGKHGKWSIRHKSRLGAANFTPVYTIRQAKEWLKCIDEGIDYHTMLLERKREQQRMYRERARRKKWEASEEYDRQERLRDLKTQAMEMGFHDMWTDSEGHVCYGPSESFPNYY